MTATAPEAHSTTFDTDSTTVGIDNRCTACISDDVHDFIGPLQDSKRVIKGFGGSRTPNVKSGTICWWIVDDQGQVHVHKIPGSYYVPHGKVKLFSPQHFAKAHKDIKLVPGTKIETLQDKVILFWDQRKYKLTIPLDPASNVVTF